MQTPEWIWALPVLLSVVVAQDVSTVWDWNVTVPPQWWCNRNRVELCHGRVHFLQQSTDSGLAAINERFSVNFSTTEARLFTMHAVDWNYDGAMDLFIGQKAEPGSDVQQTPDGWQLPVFLQRLENGTLREGKSLFDSSGNDRLEQAFLRGFHGVGIASADWNNDGHTDLFYFTGNGAIYFEQDAHSRLLVPQAFPFSVGSSLGETLYVPTLLDWDGDNRTDVVLPFTQEGEETTCPYRFFLRKPDGGLDELLGHDNPFWGLLAGRTHDRYEESPHSHFSPWLAAADFLGNGKLDVLASARYRNSDYSWVPIQFMAFERLGDGSLVQRLDHSNPFVGLRDLKLGLRRPQLVDWNGDGLLDVLLGDSDDTAFEITYLQHYVDNKFVQRVDQFNPLNQANANNEQRQERIYAHTPGKLWLDLPSPVTADWNHDGQQDLIIGKSNGKVYLFERLKAGHLKEHSHALFSYDAGTRWTRLIPEVADWDHDGRLNLLLGFDILDQDFTPNPDFRGEIKFFRKSLDGDVVEVNGTSNPFWGIDFGRLPSPRAVDWDQDGYLDLIVGNWNGTVTFFRGQADGRVLPERGRFQEAFDAVNVTSDLEECRASQQVGSIVNCGGCVPIIRDWNKDGYLDLILGTGAGSIRVFKNIGNGSLVRQGSAFDDIHAELSIQTQGHWRKLGWESPELVDWNGNSNLDLVIGRADGDLMFYTPGWCTTETACSQRGFCDSGLGYCTCMSGFGKGSGPYGDCSGCGPGHYSAFRSNVFRAGTGRVCKPCAGFDNERICSDRGTCYDDIKAREAAPNPMVALTAVGNGSCRCTTPTFGGVNLLGLTTCAEGHCPAGEQIGLNRTSGLRICNKCLAGYFSTGIGKCRRCPKDEYATRGEGKGACMRCPNGLTTGKALGVSLASCRIPWRFIFPLMAAGALLLLMLPICIGVRIPIQDVSRENGKVIVNTARNHHILKLPYFRVKVFVTGTGHPIADKHSAPFQVQVLDSHRLVLFRMSGEPVAEEVDSSMGFLHACWWQAPVCSGFLDYVPVVVPLTAVLIAAVVLADQLPADPWQWPLALIYLAVGFLPVFLRIVWLRRGPQTPLQRRICEFRRKLLDANPEPAACSRGPGRAISAAQLSDFEEYFKGFIRHRTMYYVCSNILRPVTQPEQLSYSELAGPKMVLWFVSHFWGTPFHDFVETVRRQAASVTFDVEWTDITYWICTFSNNQWQIEAELGKDCTDSSFFHALRSSTCQGTAMVVDDQALPLTRSWCLFETLQTLLLTNQRTSEFKGLMLCTPSGVLSDGNAGVDVAMSLAHRLASLRLEDANASNRKDKEEIDTCVQKMEGGFPAMNAFIRANIRDAILAARRALDVDLESVVAALGQHIFNNVDDAGHKRNVLFRTFHTWRCLVKTPWSPETAKRAFYRSEIRIERDQEKRAELQSKSFMSL
eukprot:TRINITY_DN47584_c0_g1_i1.p1 TRINITY_DN47584_c0_g1~~TRINITY_DN47584_c0_g1_i1.p1  ORF type:complete len:1431 (+),score=205.99 TRINITY_DN47584_c0_g1_i1:58-4350(+)